MFFAMLFAAGLFSIHGSEEVRAASSYEVVIGDYTWPQAFSACVSKGGHLLTLDSREEFYTITGMLENNQNWRGKVFFIGGRRSTGSRDFYWVDSNDQFYGIPLNDPSNWTYNIWGAGEPSYTSEGVDETVCGIFKYQGKWILNDEPVNMLTTAPEYSGIIGYICEYEEKAQGSSNTQQAGSGSYGNTSDSFTVTDTNGNIIDVYIPSQFGFASGVGAWGTELFMNSDWSFTGDFHDSNMGESGPGYPGGTCYISNFSGNFSRPEMLTGTSARLEMQSLVFTPQDGEKNIDDEILYIGSTPYGLYGGTEFYLYFPGQPLSEIPEDGRSWLAGKLPDPKPEVLPAGFFLLYNTHEGETFVGIN